MSRTSRPVSAVVPEEPGLTEVAAGVSAFVQPDGGWCLNNAGVVTDGTTTLLVDTAATERRARLLARRIAESGAPAPRTVVNTHHHGDHTYGNAVFAPATIIGHTACRSEFLAAGHQLEAVWPQTDFGDIVLTPPSLTYTDSLTLYVGDTEVRLIHPGVAHTRGDTVVWLPRQRTVFTGDLVFNGGTPFVFMGSLAGSLRALEVLRSLDATTVVPGHGPVTGPEVYDTVEAYLRFTDELARRSHAAGLTPLEAARGADLGPFAELAESERLVANLHRAYAELEGAEPGAPLDVRAVFGDMTVMNGGVPVACHA